MTTTQYIGARYVPLFAEPLDWDITREYEPLTIVYTAGNSYTSRQSVPSGIDITNESYWALTGNYNAQIEQYRKETQAVATQLNTVKTTAVNALSLAQTNEQDISTLDSEMAGTIDSGLKTLINDEAARATGKEDSLNASITAEVTRATERESTLESEVQTNASAINAETTRATAAESANSTAIANETTRATAAENEIKKQLGTYIPEGSTIVLIGDSYVNDDIDYSTKGLIGKSLANLYPMYTFVNAGDSGSGYTAAGRLGRTFETQVTYAATQTTASDVKAVFVIGGRNDVGGRTSMTQNDGIEAAAKSCFNKIATTFVNADVYVFPFLYDWHLPTTYVESGIKQVESAVETCNVTNIYCARGCWTWGIHLKSLYRSETDIHPDTALCNTFAKRIMSAALHHQMYCYVTQEERFGGSATNYHGLISLQDGILHIYFAWAANGSTNQIDNVPNWRWLNDSGDADYRGGIFGYNVTANTTAITAFVLTQYGITLAGGDVMPSGNTCYCDNYCSPFYND